MNRTIVAVVVALIAFALSPHLIAPVQAAPVHALVKVAVGVKVPAGLAETLASWRQSGQVSDVLWLNADQRDKPGFATFIVLEFPNEGSFRAWQSEGAPKLDSSLVVTRAEVLVHGETTPRDSNNSVFEVNIYQPTVPADRTDLFAKGYIKPLMEGQRAQKIMNRYTMYLEQGSAGPGQSVLVKEYRDPVAFDRAAAVKVAVRAQLTAADKVYADFHEIKDTLRSDISETVAAYAELPPPQLPNLPPYRPEARVVGGFRIVGSELKNAVNQLAAGFKMFHPDVKITTNDVPSSEGGIAALYYGLSDVAPMGDDAKITDMMPFKNTFGYMPTEISVATGGYEKRGSLFAWAIVVNKNNPLDNISVEELERVFGAQRTGGWELVDNDYRYTAKFARAADSNIRTWDQLGLTGDYKDRRIDPFGYVAPGFAVSIERSWFHWSHKWNEDFREYVEEKQTSPDAVGARVASTVPLKDLETNPYAIGIAGLMHVRNYPNVKVLKISHRPGEPAVALTPDNVANRSYPLIRDAYFYVNRAPGRPLDPRVREFMRYVLSREGQEIFARVGYFYPLDAAYLAEQLKKLD